MLLLSSDTTSFLDEFGNNQKIIPRQVRKCQKGVGINETLILILLYLVNRYFSIFYRRDRCIKVKAVKKYILLAENLYD